MTVPTVGIGDKVNFRILSVTLSYSLPIIGLLATLIEVFVKLIGVIRRNQDVSPLLMVNVSDATVKKTLCLEVLRIQGINVLLSMIVLIILVSDIGKNKVRQVNRKTVIVLMVVLSFL